MVVILFFDCYQFFVHIRPIGFLPFVKVRKTFVQVSVFLVLCCYSDSLVKVCHFDLATV